ncbi:ly-6-related protein domain-containing protein [Ditylenchus destructor]|uniref:Ly-6-related protein domain-containing protein n=1 Tax=Ditylenchus destructor TaxID=166010 RepID=A0AAD4NKF8_9BILA|nr:ly-6-related protein domain-containing protein [Ditylenchus destructor]
MRGCASSLSRFGFYNRTLALFDQYDMCREVLANELFRYDTDSQPLLICSCLGDRCNAGNRRHRRIRVRISFHCLHKAYT